MTNTTTTNNNNPAAAQGWVKSTDPKTGRPFYANHITRKTQWDPPDGWIEDEPNQQQHQQQRQQKQQQPPNDEEQQLAPLPSNWEVMHDPTTGKPFYVDHERKITTWTRPRPAPLDSSSSSRRTTTTATAAATPSPSSGPSAALARLLQQQQSMTHTATAATTTTRTRSYSTEASYYAPPRPAEDVDWSDSLPPLEFTVKKVADALRPVCPHCQTVVFSLSKRRHHCRLCGDVFCDACSSHRVTLPLPGPEFDKPVRVCDYCYGDVSQGNFFSLRRYLTPLHLCQHLVATTSSSSSGSGSSTSTSNDLEQEGSVASPSNVNAALSALTQDVEQMVQQPSSGDGDNNKRITIPPEILLPEIIKHVAYPETADRAIRAMAALLALEAVTNTTEYSTALYLYGAGKNKKKQQQNKQPTTKHQMKHKHNRPLHVALEHILLALERSGSDRKTLYVQEQAARTLFYLTEPKTISAALRQQAEVGWHDDGKDEDGDDDDNDDGEQQQQQTNDTTKPKPRGRVEDLDLLRAIRSMLDHSSASKNPNLQRWAAACLQNLIVEDQRRSCLAVNDVAAVYASGQVESNNSLPALEYETFLPELVSTGGILLLCSLIGTDDADTRAHAVGALAATLRSTRAVDASLTALTELSGGLAVTGAAAAAARDGDIVRAMVAGGGCGASVSQLILSADHAVAGMGCNFLSSLVVPLLSSSTSSDATELSEGSSAGGWSSYQYDYRNDTSGAGACREASVEIATGSCLPALLSLVRENNNGRSSRPMELKKLAMEILAAVALSVGEMGKSWAHGQYEEGLERAGAPAKLKEAILMLNEEGIIDAALDVLLSGSGQSLGSSRETAASRMREAAGIILGSLTSCSAEAIIALQTKQILSPFLLSSNDASMTVASTLRSDAAPRCLGVLETVSAIVMFAWQHPSGAQSELLDRLIELIDAGVIPYLSKVINAPMEWDSKEKSVGVMKAKAAGCRLLCCLFGISLTDDTGIGTRRLMDAIASDARGYRGGDRMPSDIIEATLGVLQTSSTYARRVLLGSSGSGQGQQKYQSALMELVDAALLATGSMCGSSVAPGGSEGTMVTGENFLAARNDQYVGKRNDICRVACDVVVRAGRSGPALLPTMLIGGFGEGAALSSLRLALAIAQNGSKDEHAKLALSGLLVPVSDSLRAALNKGDLYRFSASLALVRFCGPHLAAGQGGGIESVRNAIRVATNVLTLPINPDASIEQMETQESLKSECISALESLSKNAALWSSISTEALPSIVQYLHSTASMKTASSPHQATRASALRAVMQIVQVPSHAVAAAESGIVEPLGKLLRSGDVSSQDNEVPMLALEILHVLGNNKDARRKARFLDSGLARSICAAVGKSATEKPNKPADSRADVTFLGLEILHSILADVENLMETQMVLQSTGAIAFLDAVASEPAFVRSLCATLLLRTNMKLPRHDADQSGEKFFDIPKLYGPPLILVSDKCAGHIGTHDAAAAILYTVCVYACAIESQRSDAFWKTVQLQDLPGVNADASEQLRLSATFCAHMLGLLTTDYKPFVPADPVRFQDYITITRPLVRYRLLESLRDTLDDMASQSAYGNDPYVISLLVGFNVPHICLSLWKDPAILDLAFELIQKIVEQEPDEVLHLFVDGKAAIMSLFDLLNLDSSFETSKNVEIRRFLASVLGQLAEGGLLTNAVNKFDVRSSAIAALASACLSEEERPNDDDEDMTSNRLSTVLMRCLVELCSVKKNGNSESKRIQLSSSEAEALAKNLGKKVCHMVLSRFLERAKLKQYEIEEDEDIMDAPDVAMLCAIAQHDDALVILRSIGGLHALSLIAAEGELSAIVALKKACSGDASVLLEGETYQALINLVIDDRRHGAEFRQLEAAAFELLARLCEWSAKGRQAVAESSSYQDCVRQAIHVVSSLAGKVDKENESKSDDEEDVKSDKDETSTGLQPPPPDYTLLQSLPKAGQEDFALEVAACSFLSAIVSTTIGRSEILGDSDCVEILSSLASKSESSELSYASLRVLSNLATFTTNQGLLSAVKLSDVLLNAMTSERKIIPNSNLNANKVFEVAVSGLNIIFDSLPDEQAKALALAAATLFIKGVKNCSVTRSTTTELERAFAAELAYSLSMTLVLVRGKSFMSDVFTQDLMISFLHLIQWRLDPKTTLGNTTPQAWDAAISNCLLLLTTLIHCPDQSLSEVGIDLKALSQTILMLARPGKAPRRAIDIKTALLQLSESKDSSAALSAKRLLNRLFD